MTDEAPRAPEGRWRLADGREVVIDEAVVDGRYNVYECPSGHYLLSMDVDEGVTPFMVTCPDDGSGATSTMYPKGLERHPSLWPVRMIWRLATPSERKREKKSGGDHYARGGLAREWVTSPTPEPTAIPTSASSSMSRQERRWRSRHG